jgi:hypothetical protein
MPAAPTDAGPAGASAAGSATAAPPPRKQAAAASSDEAERAAAMARWLARDVGPVGAGTGRPIEAVFPEVFEPKEDFDEARKDRIVKQLRRERGVPLILQHIIETPEANGAQDVYALYQYRLYAGCADGGSGCPAPEEVALNPDCRGYGIVHASFAGGAGAAKDGGDLRLAVMPLADAACDLQVRHWFVARLDGDPGLDAYLEVVSSQVLSKEPSGKKPKVTTEHRQLLYLWSGEPPPNGADAEPSFFLDLARWTVERWHQREPPVRESVVLFRGQEMQGEWSGYGALDLIHLLPCLDPQSDEACDPDLRRRKAYAWGASVSE